MCRDEDLDRIEANFSKWEEGNADKCKRERKKEFLTLSGMPVKRLYTPLDVVQRNISYLTHLGFPGEYPFTRGNTPSMYRSDVWAMTKYMGYSTAEESNKVWKELIAAGEAGVTIAFDLPTQLGYDPGHPMSEGEVGRVGVSMCSQRDWEIAFDGINLGEVIVGQVLNAPVLVGIANYLCLAQKQGIDLKELRGTCQNDILKEYVARGTFIFPPEASLRVCIDAWLYCVQHMPKYQGKCICTYHFAETGATPVHEAAFGLAMLTTYLQSAIDRGIDVDTIAPSLWFFTATRPECFFEEIAKFRAMRRVYARLLKERFKAQKAESMITCWLSSPVGSSMHKEQYLNNIARGTIASIAGCLGGTQRQGSAAYDEQFGIPTQEATITALRTQQVVAYETDIGNSVDPLGGSYFIESLTSDFEEKVIEELGNIEKQGGMISCINNGYLRRVMAQDSYEWHRAFERGDISRVGVNCFRSGVQERPAKIYRAQPEIEEQRIAAVRELKQKRDNRKVKKALEEVKAVASLEASAENNLMLPVIEAVKCYATVGEICDVMREVWGVFVEPGIF